MFYERFCALCKIHGKTPSCVLEDIGLTRMNASLWKKGGMPSSTNLQKLADYFEVPTDYLLGTHEMLFAIQKKCKRKFLMLKLRRTK